MKARRRTASRRPKRARRAGSRVSGEAEAGVERRDQVGDRRRGRRAGRRAGRPGFPRRGSGPGRFPGSSGRRGGRRRAVRGPWQHHSTIYGECARSTVGRQGERPWFSRPRGGPPAPEPFEAHSYAVDAFGLLSAPALSGWLQEAAGRHADQLGVGVEAAPGPGPHLGAGPPGGGGRSAGRAWGSGPRWSTWPSGADRLSALRDFEVRVDGEVAGPGGRPSGSSSTSPPGSRCAPGRSCRSSWSRRWTTCCRCRVGSPGHPDPAEVERPFTTRYRDIDRNLHVTNASYVEWACEAVPEEIWRSGALRSFEAYFIAECLHGSRILSRSAPARGRSLRPLGGAGGGREGTGAAPDRLGGSVAPAPLHRGASSLILHGSRRRRGPASEDRAEEGRRWRRRAGRSRRRASRRAKAKRRGQARRRSPPPEAGGETAPKAPPAPKAPARATRSASPAPRIAWRPAAAPRSPDRRTPDGSRFRPSPGAAR